MWGGSVTASAVNGIHPDDDSGMPIYVGERPVRLSGNLLLCPRCGSATLHRFCVTTFERLEDAETTSITHIESGRTSVSVAPSEDCRDPSSRRHGLGIGFWCEDCDGRAELTIGQHKGLTLLDWREASP